MAAKILEEDFVFLLLGALNFTAYFPSPFFLGD